MTDNKYLDPAQNPMIKIQPFEDRYQEQEVEDRPSFEEPLIPMGGYPEKKASMAAAAAGEKPKGEPGDFESKVKVFMDKADEVIIVAPVGNLGLFKISKRQCGALEVVDADGSRRTLADLNAEEKKIVDYNLYTKCANGKGDCPCNQI